MTRDFSALRRAFGSFADIPLDQWEALFQSTRVLVIPKGTTILRQGEAADWLAFVERGLLRNFHNTGEREVNLGFEREGGFVGAYDAYVRRAPAESGVETLEECVLLRFDRPALDALIAGHPCWRELSWRVAEAELVRKLEAERAARTRTAEERYAELAATDSDLLRRVPGYHLASYLGIAPETLSRIRTRLDLGASRGGSPRS